MFWAKSFFWSFIKEILLSESLNPLNQPVIYLIISQLIFPKNAWIVAFTSGGRSISETGRAVGPKRSRRPADHEQTEPRETRTNWGSEMEGVGLLLYRGEAGWFITAGPVPGAQAVGKRWNDALECWRQSGRDEREAGAQILGWLLILSRWGKWLWQFPGFVCYVWLKLKFEHDYWRLRQQQLKHLEEM